MKIISFVVLVSFLFIGMVYSSDGAPGTFDPSDTLRLGPMVKSKEGLKRLESAVDPNDYHIELRLIKKSVDLKFETDEDKKEAFKLIEEFVQRCVDNDVNVYEIIVTMPRGLSAVKGDMDRLRLFIDMIERIATNEEDCYFAVMSVANLFDKADNTEALMLVSDFIDDSIEKGNLGGKDFYMELIGIGNAIAKVDETPERLDWFKNELSGILKRTPKHRWLSTFI